MNKAIAAVFLLRYVIGLHIRIMLLNSTEIHIILRNEDIPIENLLRPFMENLTDSRDGEMFISEFVTAATEIQDRSRFWNIWHMLYDTILSIKETGYKDKMIVEYLLAGEYQDVKQWLDLKANLWLYENIAKDLGDNPIILYSI